MARHNPFSVEVDGRRWTGDWSVEGKEVKIRSAWGSGSAPLGRAKPENVAARVLRGIVEERASGPSRGA